MNRVSVFRTVLKWIFILLFPLLGRANVLSAKSVGIDSTATRQNDKKETSKAEEQKKQKNTAPGKPAVIKVPKARKQARPAVIVKPNIKVKPKIIRPNVRKP